MSSSKWQTMDAQPRIAVRTLTKSDVPTAPGVYALYRDGERTYVGKASSLQARVVGQHCARGASMTNSALRRNVCQHVGIAAAVDIKTRRYRTTTADARSVTAWLEMCEFAWIECPDAAAALAL